MFHLTLLIRESRLRYILEDAGIEVLVTEENSKKFVCI